MAATIAAAASFVAAVRNLDIRKVAAAIIVLAALAHGIDVGDVPLTNALPASWIPHIVAWCKIFVYVAPFLVAGHSFTALKWPELPAAPAADAKAAASSAQVKAGVILLAIGIAAALASSPAFAESRKPILTGNPINDIESVVKQQPQAAPSAFKSDGTPTCDFNTYIVLTPQNVVQLLQACGEKLLSDSQAALASATKSNDNIATACLTPGAALVQAAIGTPAVPAVEAVPATATSPAIAAAPAVPAILPGPILIFQKFREFINAGGITNCKAWVNNTITAATASGL
jgi:hypothetical protein